MLRLLYLGISVLPSQVSVRYMYRTRAYRTNVASRVVSIRAFGAQNAFREESYERINRYSRVSVAFWGLNR